MNKRPSAPLCQALLRQVFERSALPMLITDIKGCICAVNPAMERSTGFGGGELLGQRPALLRSTLQGDEFYAAMWKQLRETMHWQGEIWNRRKDGRVFRELLSISPLLGADGHPSHYLGQYAGLSQDPLQCPTVGGSEVDRTTGVLTREGFIAAADRLGRRGEQMAVLTLDIERFTDINEHLGLEAGDRLLRQVAMRCTEVAASYGGRQLVGRVGADEFAVAWVPATAQSDARCAPDAVQALAQRFQDDVSGAYELGADQPVTVHVDAGVALARVGEHQAAEALLLASAARHDAHLGGAVRHYDAHDHLRLQTKALRAAIEQRQIGIALQPKVDLRSGALCGVEALARWTLADGGTVPPSTFIPLAEREGLIAALGEGVLEQALDWAAWARDTDRPTAVAVNFSAPQFHRESLVAEITQRLLAHRLPAKALELELTESILLGDTDTAMGALPALRALGLHLSIDDFGTGYSSLSYLFRFPVDRLKLDRSFIAPLTRDARSRTLVQAVIALAHQLGMRCVAEGIETPEQLALLREFGCDEGQGYLFSQPVTPLAAFELLHAEPPWARLFAAAPSLIA